MRLTTPAFGFEEVTDGVRGAASIAEHLESRYGKDGIAVILDEGGMGLESYGDYVYALSAVSEKGYVVVVLSQRQSRIQLPITRTQWYRYYGGNDSCLGEGPFSPPTHPRKSFSRLGMPDLLQSG